MRGRSADARFEASDVPCGMDAEKGRRGRRTVGVSMRIGVMLRHYDQHGGGVRTYTRELLAAMFALDMPHEFVLLYRNPALIGTYAGNARVTERHVAGRNVISWDQLGVPAAVRKFGIDVLFNPKYSMSLAVSCPTAWVCHGLDWYVMPEASRFIDRLSHRWLVPRYAAKADAIIAVSEITREHVMHFLHVAPNRVHTVYSGVSSSFRTPLAPTDLERTRKRYGLPDRFVLYAGAVYPPKNFTRLVQAYARSGPSRGVPLVIAGARTASSPRMSSRSPSGSDSGTGSAGRGGCRASTCQPSTGSRTPCCSRRCSSPVGSRCSRRW